MSATTKGSDRVWHYGVGELTSDVDCGPLSRKVWCPMVGYAHLRQGVVLGCTHLREGVVDGEVEVVELWVAGARLH